MAIIEMNSMVFDADIESTKEYYQQKGKLPDLEISNFEIQVREEAPLLDEFLEQFGVDITKPDELCWSWKDATNTIHYNVAYTIIGEVIKTAHHDSGKSLRSVQNEIILEDKSNLHIILETGYIPNEQTKPYFGFTAYNITMPWILEMPYPERNVSEGTDVSILEIFAKKIKKYWTKRTK